MLLLCNWRGWLNLAPAFEGLGKSEGLKYNLKDFCFWRINDEHRLVYRISGTKGVDQVCDVAQCRYHYK